MQIARFYAALILARFAINTIFFLENFVQSLVELLRQNIIRLMIKKQIYALVLATRIDVYFYKAMICTKNTIKKTLIINAL